MYGTRSSRRGAERGELGVVKDGAVLVRDGVVREVGTTRRVENLAEARGAVEVSAIGRVVMPGFVDSHTHLLCPPPEVAAAALAAAGREVLSSSTRKLAGSARRYLAAMARHGTTTVEVKTGFGPDESAEMKLLRAMAALRGNPLDVVPTLLFRLPEEGSDTDAETALRWMCGEFLPKVARRRLAHFADVALENHGERQCFARRFLEAAAEAGFACKIHCRPDAAPLAAELATHCPNVTSVDHLDDVTPQLAGALAKTRAIATLLPCYGPRPQGSTETARHLIEAGVPIALASNFNPQRTPTLNMQTIIAMACLQFGLTPAEAITAATVNGAHAAGCGSRAGSLEQGRAADLIVLNISDYRELAGHFGTNLVHLTMKSGLFIYKEGAVAPLSAETLQPSF